MRCEIFRSGSSRKQDLQSAGLPDTQRGNLVARESETEGRLLVHRRTRKGHGRRSCTGPEYFWQSVPLPRRPERRERQAQNQVTKGVLRQEISTLRKERNRRHILPFALCSLNSRV